MTLHLTLPPRVWLAALGVALVLALGWVATQSGPLAPIKVIVTRVNTGEVSPALFGIGTVEAQRAYLIGPTTAGRVKRVLVDVGDTVSAGQLLAEMEPVDLDARVASSLASAAGGRSAVAVAEAQEILPPEGAWLARAYSIGNAPRDDGSIELQIRRTASGRFTGWLFERLRVGDTVRARGPLGSFTLGSAPEAPLLFVAGGTGFAPIKAMIESQLAFDRQRDMLLFWGVGTLEDLYETEILAAWSKRDTRLRIRIAVDQGPLPTGLPQGIAVVSGGVAPAIASAESLAGRDAYVAGPPAMMPAVAAALAQGGIERDRIRIDSFGF